jgi:rhamnose transport system permease protein
MTTTSKGHEEVHITQRSSQSRLVRLVSRVRELGLLIVLLLIVVIVSVQEPRFLTVTNIEQILLSVAIIAIVAIGETLVVLTRNIDLSVGSMVGFSAFVVADLFKQQPGTNLVVAILLGCALGVVLGAIN